MKKFNVKLLSLICFLFIFCNVNTFAQKKKTEKESTTKVVIVKKIKDKDGKVRVERIEKEGKEAEKYIKELNIKGADGQSLDLDIEIDGDEVITSDGKKKKIAIIEIDDISELSDELKKELKDLDIEVEILDDEIEKIIDIKDAEDSEMIFVEEDENIKNININKNNDETTIDIKTKDGQKKKFKYTGKMPADVRKELEAMGVKTKKGNPVRHKMHKKKVIRMQGSANKAFLGVEMGDKKSDKGIYIDKVVKESAAEKAGLKSGDIITAIDESKTAKFGDLVEALSEKKVGDKIAIEYLRDDKSNKTEATLGESKAGSSWITKSKDGEEVEIRIDMDDTNFDYEFDLDGSNIEIEEDGENIFYFRKAGGDKGKSRPFLGIHMNLEDESDEGVLLEGTTKGSGADKAGLKKDDVVTSIDGKAVNKLKDVTAALADKKTGDRVVIEYTRDGKSQSTEAELGERTASKTMTFEFDDDKVKKFDGKKKVKRKVIVIKKDDDAGNEVEEEIIIENDDNF